MTPAPDATSPASQVGDDHGSFSQAKIPTGQTEKPVVVPVRQKPPHVGSRNFAAFRKSRHFDVADLALWEECSNPPTTAEHLARLKRSGEPKEQTCGFWDGVRAIDAGEPMPMRSAYRPRLFIRPLARGPFFNRGYWWRTLP